ncbi:MAG TPA: bifunctional precorrin-2 dehydrogenase/sirohydrochlorin ferrochelatase [Bryobacteraceae bacterium]|jgi:siroheme synthase-like protein|nr:bifunctional precorrin-2 dehydrogenase/sirohydrochlorin ferrochelatase [Bryobacteraceae bacterium]
MNFRFPVFLDVSGKNCIVTGEGFEVPAKVEGLVKAGANTTYIHPTADPRIQELIETALVRWERRDLQPDDLDSCFLIIADTPNNAAIFEMAEERRVLCNAVDDPTNCRFSFGSVHRQADLTIAVSTNGWAPALAVRLKQWLQKEIGPEYGELLELLREARPEITSSIGDFAARRDLWYELVDSAALEFLRNGERDAAATLIQEKIAARINSTSHSDISVDAAGR